VIIIGIVRNGKEIDPLNEYLFPKLFGERGCEEETLHLLNIITEKNFKNLSYEPSEIEGLHRGNKKSNVDVLIVTDDATVVNIESQINQQKEFHKRSHFYNSKIYSVFLKVGGKYKELPKTIMINILSFDLHGSDDYHSTFVLCDKRSKNYMIEDIVETHYIELPKFRKELKKGNLNLNDPKVRLILFLDVKTPQDLFEEVIKMDKTVNKLYEKTLHVLKDQKEYLAYIRAEQAEQDHKNMIKYAAEKGEKIGVEKGKIEGERVGVEKGKIEIAINLKKLDFPLKKIAEITGISMEEIKELFDNMEK
jgi:predicted transposase/invertase (TIGR01784 family)